MKITELGKIAKDGDGTRVDQEQWGCLMITVKITNEQLSWLLEGNTFSFVGLRLYSIIVFTFLKLYIWLVFALFVSVMYRLCVRISVAKECYYMGTYSDHK